MDINILSKARFDQIMEENNITDENVENHKDIMLISICDTDMSHRNRKPYFNEDHENVMNLRFDDVEHDGESSPTQAYDTIAFTEEMAEKLFKFIKKHRNKEMCIVHCMAGISRSGAVGTFINGYCGGDWEKFKRTNPRIIPNPRVHRMLNQAKYNEYEK